MGLQKIDNLRDFSGMTSQLIEMLLETLVKIHGPTFEEAMKFLLCSPTGLGSLLLPLSPPLLSSPLLSSLLLPC
jgi:hypothetical protein